MTENGFNDIDRLKVGNTRDYIIEQYFKDTKTEAIDALDIINLLPTNQIRDEEVISLWNRYQFCKNNPNIPAYEGGYDKVPKEYKDFSVLVSHCTAMKNKLKREASV